MRPLAIRSSVTWVGSPTTQAWDASFFDCFAGRDPDALRRASAPIRHRLIRLIVVAALAFRLTVPSAYAAPPFSISSPDFQPGLPLGIAQIGEKCGGKNQSPAVQWQHAPAGTTSFAITLYDRDAPGRGWWFWAVAGIPASIDQLPANAAASGALAALGAMQARNDAGDDGYTGPCLSTGANGDANEARAGRPIWVTAPDAQFHRFRLTVYALKGPISHVAQGLPAPFFEHEIANDAIAQASLEMRTATPGPRRP
ncbi:YbhB/YbcL family Raf kinase inhibitor-like protein [Robbsia sp. KACC 23696]|uniref:YbhB/YbcL family Raf kinase inhibitor-like protein n=1 Tax=Robbsia sp. KACC 23696 TaxID=3149231 RepID=UPI00325AA450